MGRWLLCFFLCSHLRHAAGALPDKYLVSYGDPSAKIHVQEYYAFSCPQCINLFKKEFPALKKKYLDSKEVYWTFHPYPMDLLTIQAMACLENLSPKEKRIFLEALLVECDGIDPSIGKAMMQRAMEVFSKPLPELGSMAFIEKTDAFRQAFLFMNDPAVKAIPTIAINDVVYQEMPKQEFIETKIENLRSVL